MKKLTDAELSLAVAKIIWSNYNWLMNNGKALQFTTGVPSCHFDHTTDEAGFKMVSWLGKCRAGRYWLSAFTLAMGFSWADDDEKIKRAIAEAIVEVGKTSRNKGIEIWDYRWLP